MHLALRPTRLAPPLAAARPTRPPHQPGRPGRRQPGRARRSTAPPRALVGADEPTTATATPSSRQALVDLTRKVGQLGRAGRAADALDTVAAAVRAGRVTPDARLATAVLDACVGNARLALTAYESLFGEATGLKPDARAFEALARACAAADPPAWAELGKLMAAMSAAGLAPTPAVFNAALGAAARTKDLERGAAIIAQMEAAGIEPSAGTVEAVRQRRALRSLLKKAFGA